MKVASTQRVASGIQLESTRRLTFTTGGHLSAASGLVKVGNWFWVVADDELHVGRFNEHQGERVRVFPGDLPPDHKGRKKRKPDLEALVYLDRRQSGLEHDALLAFGSGSKPTRFRGAIIPVTPAGDQCAEVSTFDLSLLYTHLATKFPELNIEGAAITGNILTLAHRANSADKSALISLDIEQVAQALRHNRPIPKSAITAITPLMLGTLDGTPLSITDIAALPDGRLVFTAAAEATKNSYDDGTIIGSVIGIIDQKGNVVNKTTVTPVTKLEGVYVLASGRQALDLALVCDPDAEDPEAPENAATLFRATLQLQ